jgi:hypothetical protein
VNVTLQERLRALLELLADADLRNALVELAQGLRVGGAPPDAPAQSRSGAYLTTIQAAAYLEFSSAKAFRTWRERHPERLRAFRLGRELRFRARDLDDCLQPVGESNPFKARHLSSHRRRSG